MSKIFFSICIPALNEEHYIGRLLDGLAKQTYKNFEVVLVEGNSDDKTVEVAKKFNNKLNLRIYSVKKRNQSYQRNLAAKKAKYPNLIFLDADAQVGKKFLETIVKRKEEKDLQVATTWLKPEGNKLVDKTMFLIFNAIFLESVKKIKPGGVGAFVYIQKTAFEKIGGFNEEMKYVEDFELFEKAHKMGLDYHLFRDLPFIFSTRRLNQEGRVKWLTQLVKGTYYFYFKRSVTDLNSVDYKFGNYKKNKS